MASESHITCWWWGTGATGFGGGGVTEIYVSDPGTRAADGLFERVGLGGQCCCPLRGP